MRGLILALGLLTRLPLPALRNFQAAERARAIAWFPVAGLCVGAAVVVATYTMAQLDPWLGAFAGLLAWVWITGGLHLDGLADSLDALGAAHRDPARFLAVLGDPHLGSFGVIALVLQLLAKLILLKLALQHALAWPVLLLIPAWARWAAAGWTLWLPPLKPGLGTQFAQHGRRGGWVIGGVLLGATASWQPAAALCVLPAAAWGSWLKLKFGGQTGDLLGAGIELAESVGLLLALVVIMR